MDQSVTLIALIIAGALILGFWIQEIRLGCSRRAAQALTVRERIENTLLRSRAAVRDLLAGGEAASAKRELNAAYASFQREVDQLREDFKSYPDLLDAALKLRDLVTGPLNALYLRHFSTGAQALVESTAYDNLNYPELRAEQDRLMQELSVELNHVRRTQMEKKSLAEKAGIFALIATAIGLLYALVLRGRALAEAKQERMAAKDLERLIATARQLAEDGRNHIKQVRSNGSPASLFAIQMRDAALALEDKIARVNSASASLSKVAEQSNLLSLNAGIEAEKAGEYGLGFAVIAMEIRRLSDQTIEAAGEIEQILIEIRTATAGGLDSGKHADLERAWSDAVAKLDGRFDALATALETIEPYRSNGQGA